MVHFNNDWDELLKGEFDKPYYLQLRQFLIEEYRRHRIHPHMNDIFNALKWTAYRDVKVVILGQDPYHGVNQAHGLSFSVQPGVDTPPSLQNIYKELQADVGCFIPDNGYLESWARQGVLLLNAALTVREGLAASHRGRGWEQFTDRVMALLNAREEPIVFLLWGSHAKEKAAQITAPQHRLLTAPHPSPLSAHRGFFGCRHFSKTNLLLSGWGKAPIDWQIPNLKGS